MSVVKEIQNKIKKKYAGKQSVLAWRAGYSKSRLNRLLNNDRVYLNDLIHIANTAKLKVKIEIID